MRRDYPVIMGVLFGAAVTTIIANIITDLIYGALDRESRQLRRRAGLRLAKGPVYAVKHPCSVKARPLPSMSERRVAAGND